MPTIKLNAAGKVITKNGKPSCTCCCVCDFTIYAELVYDEYGEEYQDRATIFIVNNSTCPLIVSGIGLDLGVINPMFSPNFPQTVAGTSTLVVDFTDIGSDVRGLTMMAFTNCGEYVFNIPLE